MHSKAATVQQYLAELPEDRHSALSAVREVILENLDEDYEEGMQCGMISYYVPHRVFPAGYHCNPIQPLPFVCLASQKNYMSLYLMCVYAGGEYLKWFEESWAKAGKKLDMGKSCVRFKKLEDVALDVVGEAIRRVPAKKYLAFYEAAIDSTHRRAPKNGVKTRKSAKASKAPKRARPARSKSRRSAQR